VQITHQILWNIVQITHQIPWNSVQVLHQILDKRHFEVKSGKNVKSESLNMYRTMYAPSHAVRASLKKYGVMDGLYSVPLYLIGSLPGIL